MPRYRPESPLGYDLDLELPFMVIEGRKCQIGSAGSVMLMCPKCGATKFRMELRQLTEPCFRSNGTTLCDGDACPVAFDDLDFWNTVNPITSTVEERKARRLEEERLRPWKWVFGNLTEADFPDGLAEVDGKKVAAYQAQGDRQ